MVERGILEEESRMGLSEDNRENNLIEIEEAPQGSA